MKNLYFLPYWYIQNRENKKNKNLKIFILIILIFNIIMFNIYSINKDKLSSIENKLKEHTFIGKSQYSRDNTIKSFMDFYDYISKEKSFKSINIENRNIEIDIMGKEQECFSLIKDVENSNKFVVKNFSCLGNDKEEKTNWKINLFLK